MRIAFFGGTFDPPHCGHIAIARAAIRRAQAMRGRIVAVGTTVVRALEHAAAHDGVIHAGAGVRRVIPQPLD